MGVVIIGAGRAGVQVALSLRQVGHPGGTTLIGAKPHAPYRRLPLSKAGLKGQMGAERLFVQPLKALAAQGIDLRTGARVSLWRFLPIPLCQRNRS